jgi:hypothetical protein
MRFGKETLKPMRRRGFALLAFAVPAVLILPLTPARGQLLDEWLRGTTLRPGDVPPSYRLAAMGGVAVSVEDENNEINLLDYAHNYAGLVEDRPGRSADLWGQGSPWHAVDAPTATLTEYRGLFVERLKGRQAVGVDLGREHTDYHSPAYSVADLLWAVYVADVSAFETNKIGPNPDTVLNAMAGQPIDLSLNARTTRPSYAIIYNRLLSKAVSIAVRGGYRSEDQEVARTVNYSLQSTSKNWLGEGGLAVTPIAGLTVGGLVRYDDLTIRQTADGLRYRVSSAHYDTYKEPYPVWSRSGHAFISVGSMLRGGVAIDRVTGHGSDSYQINWGDLIALQRTGGAIQATGTRFIDRTASTTIRTRWMAHPLAPRYSVGASFDRSHNMTLRQTSGPDSITSVITHLVYGETNLDEVAWLAQIGASVALPARSILAVEYLRGRTTKGGTVGGQYAGGVDRTRGGRAGLEMGLLPRLAARTGYSRLTHIDTGDHVTQVTAGVGYSYNTWLTADFLFAVSNDARESDVPPARPSGWTRTLALYARLAL